MAGTAPAAEMLDTATFSSTAGKACIFPFRSNKILYYGCTNFTGHNLCAVEVDRDYNAKILGQCSAMCHIQGKLKTSKKYIVYEPVKCDVDI